VLRHGEYDGSLLTVRRLPARRSPRSVVAADHSPAGTANTGIINPPAAQILPAQLRDARAALERVVAALKGAGYQRMSGKPTGHG
jgi:hypothetical protein